MEKEKKKLRKKKDLSRTKEGKILLLFYNCAALQFKFPVPQHYSNYIKITHRLGLGCLFLFVQGRLNALSALDFRRTMPLFYNLPESLLARYPVFIFTCLIVFPCGPVFFLWSMKDRRPDMDELI